MHNKALTIFAGVVGVDGLLHHALVQLGVRQLAPHGRVVAPLRKLVRSVQVVQIVDQNLGSF